MSRGIWPRRLCALLVALVAAYSSFEHQRRFALDGGADQLGAVLWPLSVDGLVVLASLGLLNLSRSASWRTRWSVWGAFTVGVVISLAANIAAAPELSWRHVVVAGWPPIALLLAVELLVPPGLDADAATISDEQDDRPAHQPREASRRYVRSAPAREVSSPSLRRTRSGRAEDAMWSEYQCALAQGRQLSGAELDRLVGTNNYGRSVLARWRRSGLLDDPHPAPHPPRPPRGLDPTDPGRVVDVGANSGSDNAARDAA